MYTSIKGKYGPLRFKIKLLINYYLNSRLLAAAFALYFVVLEISIFLHTTDIDSSIKKRLIVLRRLTFEFAIFQAAPDT